MGWKTQYVVHNIGYFSTYLLESKQITTNDKKVDAVKNLTRTYRNLCMNAWTLKICNEFICVRGRKVNLWFEVVRGRGLSIFAAYA